MPQRIRITFEINHPGIEFTEHDINEWINYTFGESSFISDDNPILFAEIDQFPIDETFKWNILPVNP
jgi:hypothetical protein